MKTLLVLLSLVGTLTTNVTTTATATNLAENGYNSLFTDEELMHYCIDYERRIGELKHTYNNIRVIDLQEKRYYDRQFNFDGYDEDGDYFIAYVNRDLAARTYFEEKFGQNE